jgi:hypothetical protein
MTMIQNLRSHWESLRTDDDLPMRSDIDPRLIPDVLDSLFIFERLNPEDLRVRIAGLNLCEMMGMEVRGQSPMTFFTKNARQQFSTAVSDVMTCPTIAHLDLDTIDKMGNEARAKMILLPLRSDFGDVNRIIGCVTPPAAGFTAPMRFNVRAVVLEDVNSNIAAQTTHSIGFAEPKVGYIMDGTSTFHSIAGGANILPKTKVRAPSYLKLVD